MEEEGAPAVPAPVIPKKRGRKPKQVRTDSLPPRKEPSNNSPTVADQPAGDTGGGTDPTPRTPIPRRDPLPDRQGRNTHPGLMDSVQPKTRRSSKEADAERKCLRLELEAKARAYDEAKIMLARVELREERVMQDIEEEGRQPLEQHLQGQIEIQESEDEEFQLDGIESDEEEDDDDDDDEEEEEEEEEEEPKRKKRKETCKKAEVSPHLITTEKISDRLLTEPGQRKAQS